MKGKDRNIRQPEHDKEISSAYLQRDIRPIPTRIWHALSDGRVLFVIMLTAGLFPLPFPALWLPLTFIGLIIFVLKINSIKRQHLLMRLPMAYGDYVDYGSRMPGGKGKYDKAKGTFLLGTDAKNNTELYMSDGDILTHMLILGTTGAGKTVSLVSLAFNALAQGSGFYYIDPKGDPELWIKIQIAARIAGRDDDLWLVNYINSKERLTPDDYQKITNTQNPYVRGSSDLLQQIPISFIEVSHGDNAVFGQNAQTLIIGLMSALVSKRNNSSFMLSFQAISDYLSVHKITELLNDPDIEDEAKKDLSDSLGKFGYQPGRQQQPDTFYDQYKYAANYFSLSMQLISKSHGNIYSVPVGEIDMLDLVRNRRILLVNLPSMQKAKEQTAELGKVELTALKNAAALGLGDNPLGTTDEVVDSKPTIGRSPFVSIIDEAAAIPTPGSELLLTQGRGLGMSCIIATQDYGGLEGANKKLAEQILGNTNSKIIMKQVDPKATRDLVAQIGGKSRVAAAHNYKMSGPLSIGYRDELQASVQEYDRIDYRDLNEMVEGEFVISYRGDIIQGSMFYANPTPPPNWKSFIHQFLMMPSPDNAYIATLYGNTKKLNGQLRSLINKDGVNSDKDEYQENAHSALPKWIQESLDNPQRLELKANIANVVRRWIDETREDTEKRVSAIRNELINETDTKNVTSGGMSDFFKSKEKEEIKQHKTSASESQIEIDTKLRLVSFMEKKITDEARMVEQMSEIESHIGADRTDQAKTETKNKITKSVNKLINTIGDGYQIKDIPEQRTQEEVYKEASDLVDGILKEAKDWRTVSKENEKDED